MRTCLLGVLFLVAGCSTVGTEPKGPAKYQVTLYSGGKAVKVWQTRGYVNLGTDGVEFRDAETNRVWDIVGDITIEAL